ncbi:MAG: NIF family HAD-type phosphatase [Myxococcota bacterium]
MVRESRKLLVLDLDETLIHASESSLGHSADFEVSRFHVYRRPGLSEFLEQVGACFDLAVCSRRAMTT